MGPRGLDEEEKARPEPISIPVEEQEPVKQRGFLSRIRYYEEVLDRKLGIESHSLDRVLPENRKPPNSLTMAFMWASATMNISCFSTGFLGKEFGLSLGQTIAITICATFLGAAVTVRIPFLFLWIFLERFALPLCVASGLHLLLRAGAPLWALVLVFVRLRSRDIL
jgi:hypothetical protein